MHNQIEIAKRIIELGNDLIKNDKDLSKDLFSQEWTCNTWTIEHPEIKVDQERNKIRLIGLLNGLAGVKPDGQPFIRAIYSNKGIVKLEFNDGKQESIKPAQAKV